MITTRTTSKASSAEPKCPICKRELADRVAFEAATGELEKRVIEKHSELSKKERKEFESALRDMKINHKNEIQTLRRHQRHQEMMLKKMLNDQFRKDKNAFAKKLVVMKKNHQLALQDTRDIYERQNLLTQKEQEKSVNSQLKETMQNYANLAASYQKEMEKVRKMEEEYEGVVRKKEGDISRLKIELARSNSDIQIRRLVVQLGERNASIEQLHRRIRELEAILTSATYNTQTPTNSEAPTSETPQMGSANRANEGQQFSDVSLTQRQKDLRDEFMAAIKEITREHRQVQDADSTEAHGSSTSAPSKAHKKWGLF